MRGLPGLLLWMAVTVAEAAALVDGEGVARRGDAAKAPIVDARDISERSLFPVPGALGYEPGLRIAEKVIVVIGDRDEEALAAARALEQRHPGLTALALKGGYETLRGLRPAARLPPRVEGAMPSNFTIPSDTCQTGAALHTFGEEQE